MVGGSSGEPARRALKEQNAHFGKRPSLARGRLI
jgi:hypothetical protein